MSAGPFQQPPPWRCGPRGWGALVRGCLALLAFPQHPPGLARRPARLAAGPLPSRPQKAREASGCGMDLTLDIAGLGRRLDLGPLTAETSLLGWGT